jgi:hypothetical protein
VEVITVAAEAATREFRTKVRRFMFPPERLFAQAGKKVSGMIRDKK